MNYYLIDAENIHIKNIKELKAVSEEDAITFFYSEQCKNVPFDVIDSIMRLKMKYESFKVSVGTKNALDFQIATYLGFIIGNQNNIKAKYYIVSNDKGYDYLCDYWKNFNVQVERIAISENCQKMKVSSITKDTKKENKKKSNKKLTGRVTIEDIKSLLNKDDKPEEVLRIFNQQKTKIAINNGLAKYYKDSKKASSVYKKLKPLLKNKN